jgi:hypothetical protein
VPPLFFTNYIILKKFFIKNLFFAQALITWVGFLVAQKQSGALG